MLEFSDSLNRRPCLRTHRQGRNPSELSIEDASPLVTPDEAQAESGDQRNPSSLRRGAGIACSEAQSMNTAEGIH